MSVTTTGAERYRHVLATLKPRDNPRATRAAMRDSGKLLKKTIPNYLRGPRPHRLESVTGELVKSVTENRSELPWAIEAGIPRKLYWAEWHETGDGFRRRPFVEPALEAALDRIPAYFLAHWEESIARLPGTST
jgi:hypothetical protein